MVRTQIQLHERQARVVREIAQREQISMAEVIRRCIDDSLQKKRPDRAEAYRRALTFVGSCRDLEDVSDMAVNHDRYLDEAFE